MSLYYVIIGLVIGAVAKLVMPGRDLGGIIVTILLGIAGSIVATWLGRVVGLYQPGQSAGFIMSVAGAHAVAARALPHNGQATITLTCVTTKADLRIPDRNSGLYDCAQCR